MQDFILEAEVKITAKPVHPKTGLRFRGPYERNLFVTRETSKTLFVGTKANIATMVENAIKPISRQWALDSNDPPQVLAQVPSEIYDESAVLAGKVHDHGVSTVVTFEFGTDPNDLTGEAAAESPLSGDAWTDVSLDKSSLEAGTQYYYRVKAVSDGATVYSNLVSFETTDDGSVAPTATPTATPTE